MKLKVEKVFIDKITQELHKVGDVFEVDTARGEELLADNRKLVTVDKARKKASTKK